MTGSEGTGEVTGRDEPGSRHRWPPVVRWGAAALVVVGVVVFLAVGAGRPADPHLLRRPARPQVPGFGEIVYRIDPATGHDANGRCALLADTDVQQQQGLMNRTDLAGHDGMLFRFRTDVSFGFYMKDILIPLSIAWFDANGNFVSQTDMEPCHEQVSCPNYYAARPYRLALEVPKGGLGELGVGPGSHLSVGGSCS